MAEQSDGGGGGPPLPPKRPTIIRAQPAVKSTNGEERPVPSRPVPPIPGSKPPVPQHSSKPTVPPHSPGHKIHKIIDGGVPHLPEDNPLSPIPDHKLPAATSKSTVRKRPEITIVGARPMSEVGFRLESSPTPPPPPARPLSLVGHNGGGAPPLPKREASLEPEPKTPPSRPNPPVPDKPLPPAPSSRPKFPLRPSQPAKPKPQPKQPEEGLLIDFSDEVQIPSQPPLIPTPGSPGTFLLDSGSSETSIASSVMSRPSPAVPSSKPAGGSGTHFPAASSTAATDQSPRPPPSVPSSLPVPSQPPPVVPKSPRPIPASRSISPAVPHQPVLPDKPQIPAVKPRTTPESEKPAENFVASEDLNDPLPEKPKRPTIIRPKKTQEASNDSEESKQPPPRPKPMTPKATKRSTIADIPVSQIIHEVPEYAEVIRPKNKSLSASEDPREQTQSIEDEEPPPVPPKLFNPTTAPKPTVLPKPRQSLISPKNDIPGLDTSSALASEVKSDPSKTRQSLISPKNDIPGLETSLVSEAVIKSDPPKNRPTIIRPPPKPLRLHEIEANSGENAKDELVEKKPDRPPRPISRVQVLPTAPQSTSRLSSPATDANPFPDEDGDEGSNSESEKRPVSRPPRPVSRVPVLPVSRKPPNKSPTSEDTNPFQDDNESDSESQRRVQILPTPSKSKPNPEVELNPCQDGSESDFDSHNSAQVLPSTQTPSSHQNGDSVNSLEDSHDNAEEPPKKDTKSVTPSKPRPPKIQPKALDMPLEENKGWETPDKSNDVRKGERGPPRPKPPSPKDSVEKRPSRTGGPPPRPVSAAPGFSPAAKDRPSKPQPPRPGPPPTKKLEKQAAPPSLPPRPTPSHELYHYILTYPHGIAEYDFEASHDDEISFKEGEIIILTGRAENEWLKGKTGHSEGIFPASFIEIIHPLHSECPGPQDSPDSKPMNTKKLDWPEEADDRKTDSSPSPSRGSRGSISSHDITSPNWADDSDSKPDTGSGPRCRARFDFEGEGQGDLEFEEGDVIKILKHVGTDWLQGELGNKTGMFPLSFVEIIEDIQVEAQRDPDQENVATTVFDFEGLDGELSFQAGEKVTVLSQVNSEWLYGEVEGRQGKFPHTFIDIIPDNLPLFSSQSSPVFQEESASSSEDKSPTVLYKCTALHDYDSAQIEDLCFNAGDTIEVLQDQGEWLEGRLHTRIGIFPKSFVEIDAADNEEKTEEQLGKALFDFDGENEKELTFKKDDVIKLGELVTGTSDWQWGNLHGKKGIFPINFITLL